MWTCASHEAHLQNEGYESKGAPINWISKFENRQSYRLAEKLPAKLHMISLDVRKLLDLRKMWGDRVVEKYEDGRLLDKKDLYGLDVDILIPGARPHVIHENNVEQIKAKVISSIANIPITDKAEAALFEKGIHSIPDFISNAGGIVVALLDFMGGTPDDVFSSIGRASCRERV